MYTPTDWEPIMEILVEEDAGYPRCGSVLRNTISASHIQAVGVILARHWEASIGIPADKDKKLWLE